MLWIAWIDLVWELRPAFSREKTFFWGIFILLSFCIREDLAGVTSFVRSGHLYPRYYTRLTSFFHSSAINLDELTKIWFTICLKIFGKACVRFNGKIVLIADGIKIGKEGRKMPGVKLLHQSSQSNSKAEYIMGHSFQAIGLLVKAKKSFFSVPLVSRIHEGYKFSPNERKTLMDKIFELLSVLSANQNYYFLADAYYACQRIGSGLLENGDHLISRVRKNAVAYLPYVEPKNCKKKKGRPKKYGKKVQLLDYFKNMNSFSEIPSPVYGEKDTIIKVKIVDCIWKGIGEKVRYVFVSHPNRGKIILLSTDLNLSASEIVELYGYRFKIEISFKGAVHTIGTYSYHFWMMSMDKRKRGDGNIYLHRKSQDYRDKFLQKINAYHLHVQFGLIAQGIIQYLAINYSKEVWQSFGGWLRTIRPGIPPSEKVVSMSLRAGLLDFLAFGLVCPKLRKFFKKRLDLSSFNEYRLAG